MNRSDYDRLLQQMCEHLRLPDSEALQKTGMLRVGGHELLLHYDDAAEPGVIQARLDMGTVDQDLQEWMWYRLLTGNFAWGANGILGWSLTPYGNHAILTAQHPLDALFNAPVPGHAIADWLRDLIACAEAYWRDLPSRRPVEEIRSLLPLQRVVLPARPEAASWDMLIDAFCAHAGLTEQDGLLTGGDILTVDDVDMLLRHDKAAPGRFEVCIDLGMDIALPREKLWLGLLWNNFVTGLGGRVLFSVHPERDAVVLTVQQDLPADASAEDFAALLHAIAGSAKHFWIETRTAMARAEADQQGRGMAG